MFGGRGQRASLDAAGARGPQDPMEGTRRGSSPYPGVVLEAAQVGTAGMGAWQHVRGRHRTL